MTLLIDIGNSRMKWATSQGRRVSAGGVIEYRATDLAAVLEEAWQGLETPKRVLACSVAGDTTDRALADWVLARWAVPMAFVVAGRRACGVVNAYQQPDRLGADRWAALIAARSAAEGGACVIDCGTAVTVDLLGADGQHLGGLIAPGLGLARQSLSAGTGRIGEGSEPSADGRVSVFARSTRDAVDGGALYQLVAFIDRVCGDLRGQYGRGLRLIITGGDAETLLPLLAVRPEHRPQLVFEGMAELARSRRSQRSVEPT